MLGSYGYRFLTTTTDPAGVPTLSGKDHRVKGWLEPSGRLSLRDDSGNISTWEHWIDYLTDVLGSEAAPEVWRGMSLEQGALLLSMADLGTPQALEGPATLVLRDGTEDGNSKPRTRRRRTPKPSVESSPATAEEQEGSERQLTDPAQSAQDPPSSEPSDAPVHCLSPWPVLDEPTQQEIDEVCGQQQINRADFVAAAIRNHLALTVLALAVRKEQQGPVQPGAETATEREALYFHTFAADWWPLLDELTEQDLTIAASQRQVTRAHFVETAIRNHLTQTALNKDGGELCSPSFHATLCRVLDLPEQSSFASQLDALENLQSRAAHLESQIGQLFDPAQTERRLVRLEVAMQDLADSGLTSSRQSPSERAKPKRSPKRSPKHRSRRK